MLLVYVKDSENTTDVYVVSQTWLSTCCSTEEEKRLIWLYESAAILVLSLVIYMFHHVPYILVTLAASTVLYTQLLGRVDFG